MSFSRCLFNDATDRLSLVVNFVFDQPLAAIRDNLKPPPIGKVPGDVAVAPAIGA